MIGLMEEDGNYKPCVRCGSTDRYPPGRGRKVGTCKPCDLARPERDVKATRTRYRKAHPDQFKGYYRKHMVKKKYGMTMEELHQLFENQEGLCGICSRLLCMCGNGTRCPSTASIDHNHETDEVRGLLCNGCNRGLGLFDDSPSVLRNAAGWVSCS